MTRIKTSILAISISLMFSGCSTIQSASQTVGNKIGIKDTTTASTAGGAIIGCIGGGVIGYATGAGVAQGCAYGGVALGAVAGITAYEKQLNEAKKVQEELAKENSDLKMVIVERDLTIESKDKEVKEANTKAEASKKALEKTVIEMPKKKVAKPVAKSNFQKAFDATAKVANQTPEPNKSTIKIYASKSEVEEYKAQVAKTNTIDVKKVNVEYIVSSTKKIECIRG